MATASFDLHALIAEARRRARRRPWLYAGALALLAGVGIWGGLALTGGSGSAIPPPAAPPGYHLVRARGSVRHALVATSLRGAVNGYPAGKDARSRLEVWLDRTTGLMRLRGRWGGFPFADESSSCAPFCAESPPADLLESYWPVDTTKFVRRPGLGTFHGRQVIWLGKRFHTFAPGYRDGEWIALDPHTHDAVAWRQYGTTDRPAGQIINEVWVVKRFPDLSPNRFWFALEDRFDFLAVQFQPVPLYVPGREPAPDLRHAARIVVGRLAGATIFAARRSDGSWRMFSVGEDGRVGHASGGATGPDTLRIGVLQRSTGGLFASRAYLVVAGRTLAQRRMKLVLVFGNGRREPLELTPTAPSGEVGFHYYTIPTVSHVPSRQMPRLEVVRGSRVLARQALLSSQAPKQPGPLTLQTALRVFDSSLRPSR